MDAGFSWLFATEAGAKRKTGVTQFAVVHQHSWHWCAVPVQAAAAVVRQHGWQGLYAGNGLNVLRSAPQKALDFFAFDVVKAFIRGSRRQQQQQQQQLSEGAQAAQTFFAAGVAGEPRFGVASVASSRWAALE